MKTKSYLTLATIALLFTHALVTNAQAGPGPQNPPPRRSVLQSAVERSVTLANPKAPIFVARSPALHKKPARVATKRSDLYAATRKGIPRS